MGTRANRIRLKWKQEMRDGKIFMCALCGKRIEYKPLDYRENLSVDHIVPKAHGGNGRSSNLQPTHIKCNGAKGDYLETQIPTHIKKQPHDKS